MAVVINTNEVLDELVHQLAEQIKNNALLRAQNNAVLAELARLEALLPPETLEPEVNTHEPA